MVSSNSLELSLLWFCQSGSRRQLLTVSGLYLSISMPSGSGKSGAWHSRHLTSPAVLGLLPFIFLAPTWHKMTKYMREPKGSGNSLKSGWGLRKAAQKAPFVFAFPCLIPAAWEAMAPLFSGTVICLLLAALEFHVALLAQSFWRLVFPGPWQQICLAPVPQEQQWRWASVLRMFLFGHSVKSPFSLSFSRLFFHSPLPPLAIRGRYLESQYM